MKSNKILIVEDELVIAKTISIILENEGYETIYGITRYEDAINYILNNVVDLVLIDIQLKGISDGVDLGNYLLKMNTIPFVYITSNTDDITINRVKDTRPHGFISKPFKSIDILATVEIVLNNFSHIKIDNFRHETDLEYNEEPFILKKVVEYINDNISRKITLDELADLTKWSRNHFILVFKKYINQSPYNYILIKRIEKAKAEIRANDFILMDISIGLGFKSYSNFCNAFKKITGKTPEQYKKEALAKKHII
jgi:AraC-like DNA-binding protein/CheY-like chemotaxis protein